MTSEPLVSCIVPAFNSERHIGQSVRSILDQTYRNVEVIVVDDGSSDRTFELASTFDGPVTVIRTEHAGVAPARNAGIARATGSSIAFLDADDVWLPDKLQAQVNALVDDPGLDTVFGLVSEFSDEDRAPVRPLRAEPVPGMIPSAMMVRTSSFHRVGHFQGGDQLAEWLDWWARAVEEGFRWTVLERIVARRRIHSTNVGIVRSERQIDYVRALKASLDRRRARR